LPGGLPHSETPGSPIARIAPGLVAACHVLPRLSVPRHPPDALALRLIHNAAAHRGKTRLPQQREPKPPRQRGPLHQRPHMKTLLRTHRPKRCSRFPTGEASLRRTGRALAPAHPPRSHDNSRFTLQTTRPAPRRGGKHVLLRAWRGGARGGGGERIRTDDLLLAKQALSQLSYTPSPLPEQQMSENRRAEILPFCVLRFCHLDGGPGRI
jgi:hypothetical protein